MGKSTPMPQHPNRTNRDRSTRLRNVASTLLITLIPTVVISCSTDQEPTPTTAANRPSETHIQPNTFVWSAEPGIDLQARYGELGRAAMEAGAVYGSRPRDNAFPGYFESRDRSTVPPYLNMTGGVAECTNTIPSGSRRHGIRLPLDV